MIGFIVNPVAGMGGAVALKGTDGVADEAIALGAEPISPARASEFMMGLAQYLEGHAVLACGPPMGARILEYAGIEHQIVYEPSEGTTAQDTRLAVEAMKAMDSDIIVFCGGDGTAVDVLSSAGAGIPVLGVPAGVKMHSGVFASSPKTASKVLREFLRGGAELQEREVVDLDEEAFRTGVISVELFGTAMVPIVPLMIQSTKAVYTAPDESISKEAIGDHVREIIEDDPKALVVLGPGSTLMAVGKALGVEKTLLGVDLYSNGELISTDVTEMEILDTMSGYDITYVVVTPIGAQGFVFGRGNQQISSRVLEAVPLDNVLVVSTPAKIRDIDRLWADTGSESTDSKFTGYLKVIVGYHDHVMKRCVSGLGDTQ